MSFPTFPPAIVKAIDDEALLHGLAEYVLEEASTRRIFISSSQRFVQ